jgi:hypothetical protein
MDPIVDYYRDIAVRRRMLEFLGARHELSEATAMFITAGAAAGPRFDPLPVGELWRCLEEGMDVGRSLWDRAGLIAHLDLDYVNFNQPAWLRGAAPRGARGGAVAAELRYPSAASL